jgi:nicotinamide mononucleotide (NMN) deamidase PncC
LPIGTVWASVVTPERAIERELHLPGDREQIMSGIVDAVLGMVEEALTPAGR